MNADLKVIKDKFGENMSKLCRELFPTLLETNGLLPEILLNRFNPTHSLYDDIIENNLENEFKNFIYSLINVEKKNIVVSKTPQELMNEAEYDLYECKTEEDIQKFKSYYKAEEELCTFKGGRLNRCHVFFAVKKNVHEIKRENFLEPRRQDEYGTSVISIQFSKGKSNTLSIKNRYNHKVNNSDATFSNNLDNIVYGLTKSFENKYNLNIICNKEKFEIPGYVIGSDIKYYKYNYEINNIYYCPNNIIIDKFKIKQINKTENILIDYFIVDLKNKSIDLYDKSIKDSFINMVKANKIEIEKTENGKKIIIISTEEEKTIIDIDKNNNIMGLTNKSIIEIENKFLLYNKVLKKLELSNLTKIGDFFLFSNQSLEKIDLPSLIECGNVFLDKNIIISYLNMPNLMKCGNYFLKNNKNLYEINLPNLLKCGNCFIPLNENIKCLNMSKLKIVGNCFLWENKSLTELNLPSIKQVENCFINENEKLNKVILPSLKYTGRCFLNEKIRPTIFSAPNLIKSKTFVKENSDLVNHICSRKKN